MPIATQFRKHSSRAGFTLLELVLSLALSVIVLMAVGMAIDVHLRSFDSRRSMLEESQLARSPLRIIADDIRNVALRYEQDLSSVEALMQGGGGGATGGAPAGGEALGGEAPGGEATPQFSLYDGAALSWQHLKLTRRPDCDVCSA